MNTPDETFLSTGQASLKLAIAVSRYFGEAPLSDLLKERYGKFLRQRIRAALPLVIGKGDVSALVKLVEEGFLTGNLYQEAIRQAAEAGQTEMTAYLLRNRERLDMGNQDSLELDF